MGRVQRLLLLQGGEAPRSGDKGDIIYAAQFTFRRNNSCAQAQSIPKADYSLPPSHCVRHLPRQREVDVGLILEPRLSGDTDPCAAGYRCSKFMRAGAIHPRKADAFLRMLLIRLRLRYGTFPITRGRLLVRIQRLLPLQGGEAPRSDDEGDIICAAQFTFRKNNSCAQVQFIREKLTLFCVCSSSAFAHATAPSP